jgi:hypothetical protein
MTGFWNGTRRIEIEAPDASAALALEQRLAHLRPAAIASGIGWVVALETDADRIDEIEAAVRHWLGEIDLRATFMRVGGEVTTVTATAAPPSDGYRPEELLRH